jgi:alpha-beta hydrolase superfamily lysophospholipase
MNLPRSETLVRGVLALPLLTAGVAWTLTWLWCKPKRTPPNRTPADEGMPHEPVEFASGGATLRGWLVTPRETPAPTIVIPHSWSLNAAQMLPVARGLYEAGYAALLYDTRGHGASGGGSFITIRTFADDLSAAIGAAERRPEVDPARIGVIGHSMAGAAAIVAASQDPRIRALVSSSAFADPVELARRSLLRYHIPRWPFVRLMRFPIEWKLGTTMAEIAPRNRIMRVRAPILLMHGAADRFIPTSDFDLLTAAAGPNVECSLLEGRRHADVLRDSSYLPTVIEFLDRVLEARG